MIFADKIIRLRKKNGWSQEELAEKMNVSRQAVSKWESAQSVPDIDKFLLLSNLFGVTTDYLLKDEIEIEEYTDGTDEGIRRVTMAEANEYIECRKKAAVLIGLGVLLCIISPAALIVLSGASYYYGISAAVSVSFGIVFLLLLVAAAVVMFSYCGFKNAAFAYLSDEFETEYGVAGMVKEKDKEFTPFGIASNLIATCLCVLSPLPIIVAAFLGNGFEVCISVAAALILIGIGVMLYIIGTVRSTSMHRLLKDGEFSKNPNCRKSESSGKFATVYWLTATAVYLLSSLITNKWDYTWVLWPFAGLLYPIVNIIYKHVLNKNKE
ncbi:MAG: helix-turn-helix transcriptional regulator [Ruminococcaceae bacterium]|nr:helix-turn-helix transcriptional regulator [Oscillospiraceae bacterium]